MKSIPEEVQEGYLDALRRTKQLVIFFFSTAILFFSLFISISCTPDVEGVKISTPDEYKRTYEAEEKFILKAVASILREQVGTNEKIRIKENILETDYIVQGDWRTKFIARVKRLNRFECELTLSVITDHQTEKGWEMRRLLGKKQYDTFFSDINIQIYREIYKNHQGE